MTDVPPILFMVTSTALVLGAAITIRGLLGFMPATDSATLPSPVTGGDSVDAGTVTDHATSDGPSAPATGVRDLREPMVMTFAGVLISIFSLLAISALIHSA